DYYCGTWDNSVSGGLF
nr:immunoglobulin light chain junction region [Macaca mulatta]MOW66886.1 immunoglobulin light chain junction region [Macaca mulatta]MOW67334.1 immunoglobulin light chain junction region [Macaca mulatta]MOW67594.1 immunoglobulin light chain junction region [Macaca mulatta]MOW68470.1 immunoglobulin light chain junction region [Macaca mulatta]